MTFVPRFVGSASSPLAPIALALLFSFTNSLYAQTASSPPQVLQVGTFEGVAGAYKTIQEAVNAAHPGDWILIGPGTYHEHGDPAGRSRPMTSFTHHLTHRRCRFPFLATSIRLATKFLITLS